MGLQLQLEMSVFIQKELIEKTFCPTADLVLQHNVEDHNKGGYPYEAASF